MNKLKKLFLVLCSLSCAVVLSFGLAACGGDDGGGNGGNGGDEQPSSKEYTVTIAAYDEEKGTVSLSPASSTGKYAENTVVTINAEAKEGNHVESVKVNDTALTAAEGVYSFKVTQDSTVSVTFVADSDTPTPNGFTVTFDYGTGYTAAMGNGVVLVGGTAYTSNDELAEVEIANGTKVYVRASAGTGYTASAPTSSDATLTLIDADSDDNPTGDVDWYAFDISKNTTIHITFTVSKVDENAWVLEEELWGTYVDLNDEENVFTVGATGVYWNEKPVYLVEENYEGHWSVSIEGESYALSIGNDPIFGTLTVNLYKQDFTVDVTFLPEGYEPPDRYTVEFEYVYYDIDGNPIEETEGLNGGYAHTVGGLDFAADSEVTFMVEPNVGYTFGSFVMTPDASLTEGDEPNSWKFTITTNTTIVIPFIQVETYDITVESEFAQVYLLGDRIDSKDGEVQGVHYIAEPNTVVDIMIDSVKVGHKLTAVKANGVALEYDAEQDKYTFTVEGDTTISVEFEDVAIKSITFEYALQGDEAFDPRVHSRVDVINGEPDDKNPDLYHFNGDTAAEFSLYPGKGYLVEMKAGDQVVEETEEGSCTYRLNLTADITITVTFSRSDEYNWVDVIFMDVGDVTADKLGWTEVYDADTYDSAPFAKSSNSVNAIVYVNLTFGFKIKSISAKAGDADVALTPLQNQENYWSFTVSSNVTITIVAEWQETTALKIDEEYYGTYQFVPDESPEDLSDWLGPNAEGPVPDVVINAQGAKWGELDMLLLEDRSGDDTVETAVFYGAVKIGSDIHWIELFTDERLIFMAGGFEYTFRKEGSESSDTTYTIEYYVNEDDAEAHETKTATVADGAHVPSEAVAATPSKENYSFDGWYYKQDDVEHEFDPDTFIPSEYGATTIKVYAKWTAPAAKDEGTETISDLTVDAPQAGTALWQQTIGFGQKVVITGTPTFTAETVGVGDGVMPIIAPLQGGLVLTQFIQFRLDSFNFNGYGVDGGRARVDMGNNLTYYDGAVTLTKDEGTAYDWFGNFINAAKAAASYTITVDYTIANEIHVTITFTTQNSFTPTGDGVNVTAGAWTHSMSYHLLPSDRTVKLADAYTIGLGGYKCDLANISVQTSGTATAAPAAAVAHMHDFTNGACSCGATIENETKSVTVGAWGTNLDTSSADLYKGQTLSLEATYQGTMGEAYQGVVIQIRSLNSALQEYFLRPLADYAFGNDFLWGADTGSNPTQNVTIDGSTLAAAERENATIKVTVSYEDTTVTVKYETWKSGNATTNAADNTITFTIANMAQGAYTISFGVDGATINGTATLNAQKVNPAAE